MPAKKTKNKPEAKKEIISKKQNKTLIISVIIIILAVIITGFILNAIFSKSRAAAIVNERIITEKEMDKQYNILFALNLYPESIKDTFTKADFLDMLINETLLFSEADKKGIIATDSEVNEIVNLVMLQNRMSEDEFKKALSDKSLSISDLKSYIKKKKMIFDLLNQTIFKNISVSDKEISDYFQKNKNEFSAEDKLRAKHILVDAEEEADLIAQKLRIGGIFEDFALEYSKDALTANSGGELGFFTKEEIANVYGKEFADAVSSLKINEVSNPIKTNAGYHIIVRQSPKLTFEESKEIIKNMLLQKKQAEEINKYLSQLREKASIKIYYKQEISQPAVIPAKTNAETGKGCYLDFNLADNSVIFYHANWCPHCQNMMPIVKELQSEGYNFYFAEESDDNAMAVVAACYPSILSVGFPQFVCAGSGEVQIGESSKEELKSFSEKCK